LDDWRDHPGGGVYSQSSFRGLVGGNTLASGGWGYASAGTNTVVTVLKNDFKAAAFGGVVDNNGLGTYVPDHFLETAVVVKNVVGQGADHHLSAPFPDGVRWFMIGNQYYATPTSTTTTNLLVDPVASSVHYQP
jgi:hypothetical protein